MIWLPWPVRINCPGNVLILIPTFSCAFLVTNQTRSVMIQSKVISSAWKNTHRIEETINVYFNLYNLQYSNGFSSMSKVEKSCCMADCTNGNTHLIDDLKNTLKVIKVNRNEDIYTFLNFKVLCVRHGAVSPEKLITPLYLTFDSCHFFWSEDWQSGGVVALLCTLSVHILPHHRRVVTCRNGWTIDCHYIFSPHICPN